MMYFLLNTVLAEPLAITVSENYHSGQHLSFSDHKIDFTIPYGWTGTAEEMGLLLFSGESTMVIETEFLPDEEDIWAPFKEPLQLHSDVQLTPSKSSSKGLDVQEAVQQFQQSYQNDNMLAVNEQTQLLITQLLSKIGTCVALFSKVMSFDNTNVIKQCNCSLNQISKITYSCNILGLCYHLQYC